MSILAVLIPLSGFQSKALMQSNMQSRKDTDVVKSPSMDGSSVRQKCDVFTTSFKSIVILKDMNSL